MEKPKRKNSPELFRRKQNIESLMLIIWLLCNLVISTFTTPTTLKAFELHSMQENQLELANRYYDILWKVTTHPLLADLQATSTEEDAGAILEQILNAEDWAVIQDLISAEKEMSAYANANISQIMDNRGAVFREVFYGVSLVNGTDFLPLANDLFETNQFGTEPGDAWRHVEKTMRNAATIESAAIVGSNMTSANFSQLMRDHGWDTGWLTTEEVLQRIAIVQAVLLLSWVSMILTAYGKFKQRREQQTIIVASQGSTSGVEEAPARLLDAVATNSDMVSLETFQDEVLSNKAES